MSLFEESVMGSRVSKSFKGFDGEFFGTVTDVDDNNDPNGQRLFKIEYDDGDEEWLPLDEMVSLLVSVQSASEMSAEEEAEQETSTQEVSEAEASQVSCVRISN